MKNAPEESLTQISPLIDRYEWKDLAEVANQLKSGPKPRTLLLVADRALDISKFQGWLHDQEPTADIQFVGFEDLKVNSYRPFQAAKTLVIFEYGGLISSFQEEIVNLSIRRLPPDSYGFVFQAANSTEVVAEFDRIAMAARRVLAPDETGPFKAKILSSLQIYFWSKQSLPENVSETISSSMSALRAWMLSPSGSTEGFLRKALDHLISEVEERLQRLRETEMHKESGPSRQRLDQAIAGLSDLEERIRKRWASDIDVTAKEAAATIVRAKADCMAVVRGTAVQRDLSRAEEKDMPAILERALGAHLHKAQAAWIAKLEERLNVIRTEMDDLVTSENLAALNKLIKSHESAPVSLGPCPTPNVGVVKTAMPGVDEFSLRSLSGFDSNVLGYAGAGAIIGGGCAVGFAALLRWFIHIEIARMALVGGVGAAIGGVAAATMTNHLKRAEKLQKALEHFISTLIDAWQATAERQTRLLIEEPTFGEWVSKVSDIRRKIEKLRDESPANEQFTALERDCRLVRSLAERNVR